MLNLEVRSNHDADRIRDVIQDRLMQIGVTQDALSSIIIAKDNDTDYGNCIRHSKGFLGGNTHSYGGAGKALPFRHEEFGVVSDVIIPLDTIQAILFPNAGNKYDLLYDYALSHELGHVIDFHSRRTVFPLPLTTLKKGTSIDDPALSNYFTGIILSEFAADYHASKTLNEEAFKLMSQAVVEKIEGKQAQFGESNQFYWYIHSEQSHVVGMSLGRPDLSIPRYKLWGNMGPYVANELNEFGDGLSALIASYPNWDEGESVAFLTKRCILLGSSGFAVGNRIG